MGSLIYGKVKGTWLKDNKHFRIDEDFVVKEAVGGKTWITPSGYPSDGASIPPWAQSIIGGRFNPKYIEAAIIHDYYCDTKTRSQKETHNIFKEMLKTEHVSMWRRNLMHWAVVVHNRIKNPNWK